MPTLSTNMSEGAEFLKQITGEGRSVWVDIHHFATGIRLPRNSMVDELSTAFAEVSV